MHGLFITGTDTDVGKTWVTCLIARAVGCNHRVGVYKPACSGGLSRDGDEFWPDIRALSRATGNRYPPERICPQAFSAPLAPPVAAALEGREVDRELLRTGADWWTPRTDLLLVEGVGGFLCPMTPEETIADLAADFDYPVVVVARASLGTINHTLLTIEAIRSRGIRVAGVVLNEPEQPADPDAAASNADRIQAFSGVKVLALASFNGDEFRDVITRELAAPDWLTLARLSE